MRNLSLTARQSYNAEQSEEVRVTLVTITHEALDAPIRLSSDPTKRLSADPLRYGTISRGVTFEFVVMSAMLPDDQEGVITSASLVFANLLAGEAADELDLGEHGALAEVARAITSPADILLEQVLASAPDVVDVRYKGLRAIKAQYDEQKLALSISHDPQASIAYPYFMMSKGRFPALFRDR